MSALLEKLEAMGLVLKANGDKLKFEGSEKVLTESVMNEIRAGKAQLLEALKQRAALSQASASDATETEPSDSYDLSADQLPLVFMDQMRGGSPSDHLAHAFRLSGAVDVDRLRQSLEFVVEKVAVLRSIFDLESRPVKQVEKPQVVSEFVWKDGIPGLTEGMHKRADQLLNDFLAGEVKKTFNLSAGPLCRFVLVSVSAQEHVFAIVFHHLVGDGSTFQMVLKAVSERYKTLQDTGPHDTALLIPGPYSDYVAWRNSLESGHDGSVWLDRLRRFNSEDLLALDLPTDRTRPAVQSSVGARCHFLIDAYTNDRIDECSKRESVTPFNVLLACFYMLLARYADTGNIVIATPVSLREQEAHRDTPGMCVNTTLVAIEGESCKSVKELIRIVRSATVDAFRGRHTPLSELIKAIDPDRDLSRNPLFQVMMQLSEQPLLNLDGVRCTPYELDPGTSQFDMTLHMFNYNESIRCFFEYDSDVFDAVRMKGMSEQLLQIIDQVCENSERSLSSISLITGNDFAQFEHLQGMAVSQQHIPIFLDNFAQSVARYAVKPALEMNNDTMTFQLLDERSDQLASRLQQAGLVNGEFVGIYMDRSFSMVVALVAIMKSGCAFLPMDPKFPAERLRFMATDSGMSAVVVDTDIGREIFPESVGVVDVTAEPLTALPLRDSGIRAEDPAYMIYTSGSTGLPKGVQVSHGALANFLSSMAEVPGFSAQDRLLAVTTLSFDISLLELLLPLSVGGSVVIAGSDEVRSGEMIRTLAVTHQVSVLQATPSTWELIARATSPELPAMKKLSGGEELTNATAKKIAALSSGELWNMYGPTETTIWSSCVRVDTTEPISMGLPIANTQFRIENDEGLLQPVGVPGELLIGGDGLALGYWNRPELNDERFVSREVGGVSTRYYKTGDKVRYDHSGRIAYVGRNDGQVKFRGFRIELGEIRRVLLDLGGIADAIVKIEEQRDSSSVLHAYLLADASGTLEKDEISAQLRKLLPQYMVPAGYSMLTEWPQTPNKKIDRNALSEIRARELLSNSPSALVLQKSDSVVANAWCQLLGCRTIDWDQNLFDLGAHSMMVVDFCDLLYRQAGKKIRVVDVFANPSVRKLERWMNPAVQSKPDGQARNNVQDKRAAMAMKRKQAVEALRKRKQT